MEALVINSLLLTKFNPLYYILIRYKLMESLNLNFTNVKPYNQEEEKTEQLIEMFNKISQEYDKFNDLMSWGFATHWRRKSLKTLKKYNPQTILDIAAGTADMSITAFDVLTPSHISGIDISEKMLEIGREKVAKANLTNKINLEVQDCCSLMFDDQNFDAITIGFGIRNFAKMKECLAEMHRVLKPEGLLLIVEVNEPEKGLLLALYKIYSRLFIGLTTRYLSSDKKAYNYLRASVKAFPKGDAFVKILNKSGFGLIKQKSYTLGVCSMYLVQKQ